MQHLFVKVIATGSVVFNLENPRKFTVSLVALFFLHFAFTYAMINMLIEVYINVSGTAGSMFFDRKQ